MLPPLISDRIFSSQAVFCPSPEECSCSFPHLAPSYVRDGFLPPLPPSASLLLSVCSCSSQAGCGIGRKWVPCATGESQAVCQSLRHVLNGGGALVVLVWCRLDSSLCMQGLDKEKGHMRSLRQHMFPLINGHFGVESKSNETRNKAVTKMCCKIHSVIILLGSEYYVANIFVLLLAGILQLVLGPL